MALDVFPEVPRPHGVQSVSISNEVVNHAVHIEVKQDAALVAVHELALLEAGPIEDIEVDVFILTIRGIVHPSNNRTGRGVLESERLVRLVQEHVPVTMETIVQHVLDARDEISVLLGILTPVRIVLVEEPGVLACNLPGGKLHFLLDLLLLALIIRYDLLDLRLLETVEELAVLLLAELLPDVAAIVRKRLLGSLVRGEQGHVALAEDVMGTQDAPDRQGTEGDGRKVVLRHLHARLDINDRLVLDGIFLRILILVLGILGDRVDLLDLLLVLGQDIIDLQGRRARGHNRRPESDDADGGQDLRAVLLYNQDLLASYSLDSVRHFTDVEHVVSFQDRKI